MAKCRCTMGSGFIVEHVGKEKSPYHGVLLSSILLIAVPLLLYVMFKVIIGKLQNYPNDLNTYTAIFLGFGVGFIFQFSCVFAGLMKGTLTVVISRIVNLFRDLTISIKFAFKCYIEDIKENGIVFWIYFVIVGSTLGLSITGLVLIFNNYSHLF